MILVKYIFSTKALLGLVVVLISNNIALAISPPPDYVRSHSSIRLALSQGATVDNLGSGQDQSYDFSQQAKPATALPTLTHSSALELSAWGHVQACEFTGSGTSNGENIFVGQGSSWSIKDAVQSWALEVQNYSFNDGCAAGQSCENYTQLVWSETTQVGCAIASCNAVQDQNGNTLWGGDPGTLVVCQYAAPGNVSGAKPYSIGAGTGTGGGSSAKNSSNVASTMNVIISYMLD